MIWIVALIVFLVSCSAPKTSTTSEIPPPNPMIPATEEDARACQRLAELECPEAMHGCLYALSLARTDGVSIPSACVASAVDAAAVRRCGDRSSLTFECKKGDR